MAFTSALLLFLSVYYEFSFDGFHKNGDRIYRVVMGIQRSGHSERGNSMPEPFAPALKAEYPEVQYACRNSTGGCLMEYGDKKLGKNVRFTDPDFLKMFTFPMVKGNAATALSGLNSVVITQDMGKAFFGDKDPMGQTLRMQFSSGWEGFTVTGVLADIPHNSSIQLDALVRFDQLPGYAESANTWDNWNHQVYVQLRQDVNAAGFGLKTKPFMERHFAESIDRLKRDGAQPNADGNYMFVELYTLAGLHTDTVVGSEGSSVNASYLYLLLTVGILIVLIACINFVNLSIGRSFTRTREIGLRKTLGALPWQLAIQFWCEIVLVCLAAFVVSLVATYLLMPQFRLLFGMNIRPEMLLQPSLLALGFGVFVLVTVLAGGYPVWLIARMEVADVLRGKAGGRPARLRNPLIVAQFSIATLLIICTIVAWQQIGFLRSQPVGFNRHQIVSIPVSGEMAPARALELMRHELAGKPGILGVSGIYNNLGRGTDGSSRRSVMGFDFENREIKTTWMGVSHDFIKTLDIQLMAGHDFRLGNASDSNGIVINEAMAVQLGNGRKPETMLGALLDINEGEPNMKVIGIVKDFHYESLHQKIMPLSLTLDPRFGINYILVKVEANNLPASMDLLKATWNKLEPNGGWLGSFMDENIERQYQQEEKLGRMFITGAIIAIALSCMGLLAIVILVLAQRTREIGIRKVLGASVATIIAIIFKDFFKLVVIAILIASPVAWFAANKWLQDFSYRISIQWWVFLLAGLVTVSIALLTVLARAVAAATANPVKSLRTE